MQSKYIGDKISPMGKKSKKKTSGSSSNTIALNRKVRHEYTIEQRFEAGIVLQGWEVKSLREGKVQIADSYVLLKNGEAWLLGSVIQPLLSTSTHVLAESDRTRKLLLHKKEIKLLIGHIERKGYTVVPTAMYWKKNKVKVEIALVKGKKEYDKRADKREQEWNREKQRLIKRS